MKHRPLVSILLILFSIPTIAAGPFGLGLYIGSPTGITGKYFLNSEKAIDATIGWSLGNGYISLNSDYLWHRPNIFKNSKVPFELFFGVGGRVEGTKSVKLGPRFPIGLSYTMTNPDIELFVELALVLNLISSTSVDLNAGIGGRLYF